MSLEPKKIDHETAMMLLPDQDKIQCMLKKEGGLTWVEIPKNEVEQIIKNFGAEMSGEEAANFGYKICSYNSKSGYLFFKTR